MDCPQRIQNSRIRSHRISRIPYSSIVKYQSRTIPFLSTIPKVPHLRLPFGTTRLETHYEHQLVFRAFEGIHAWSSMLFIVDRVTEECCRLFVTEDGDWTETPSKACLLGEYSWE